MLYAPAIFVDFTRFKFSFLLWSNSWQVVALMTYPRLDILSCHADWTISRWFLVMDIALTVRVITAP
jgi:hypothetical protein